MRINNSIHRKLLSQLCLVLFLAVNGWSQQSGTTRPIIKITGGKIAGVFWEDHRGATFRGIPYALPPVGDLRWHEPMPVQPWSGVREASEFASACAQMNAGWNAAAAQNGKEDCLYLNVDTQELSSSPLRPVMLWIHGGANTGGSTDELSSGKSLCKHGVVVVSIQYRLGLLGFMAHPELTRESPHHSSGNYALLDQIAALQWIRANIAKFGGDPKRITIFGQSAGAFNVALLMASPLSKGLFVGAIEQSGPALSFRPIPTLAMAESEGQQVAEKLSAPRNQTIAFLRSIPADEFIRRAQPPYGAGGSSPNVDSYFLTADPMTVYSANHEHKVPLMIGSNGREFPGIADPERLKTSIQERFGSGATQAMGLYGIGSSAIVSSYAPYGNAGDQFVTDTMFRCAVVSTALSHSAIAPTYQYEFTHHLPGRETDGAAHGAELGYVFGTLFLPQTRVMFRRWGIQIGDMTQTDVALSEALQTYWTNFAKTGDPNSSSLTNWPAYDKGRKAYIEFTSAGVEQKKDLRGEICRLYEAK